MGKVLAVCISAEKGTVKHNAGKGEFAANHGIKGDAHAGNWHRQVSLLSYAKIEAFKARGAQVEDGAFGENLVVEGIDLSGLPVGARLVSGDVVLELTQIGKECHHHCAIFEASGDCIMPREGVFARVIQGGIIHAGEEIHVLTGETAPDETGETSKTGKAGAYRLWVLTASDRGVRGEREDESGKLAREIAEAAGFVSSGYTLLSDDQEGIERELRRICDLGLADLILTTGGTGFSPRDRVPEATLAAAERLVPGIPEAMRQQSLGLTKRAMLSRAAAAIRGRTLIVNLPGSPRAVEENLGVIITELRHGLDILSGRGGECARP